MHTFDMRKDLALESPALAKTVYRGFCAAKDAAMDHYKRSERAGTLVVIAFHRPVIRIKRRYLGRVFCKMHFGTSSFSQSLSNFRCVISSYPGRDDLTVSFNCDGAAGLA
jgi:hypothetical protein